jgi:predicted RNA-binding protein with PUA-like domain
MAAKRKSDRRYWLFKSEPDVFSFADLMAAPRRRTCWDGVRNYQARNLLRDEIKVGDGVLFYHSNTEPMAIAGIARVVEEGYPDAAAFDAASRYHDPDSDADAPTWYMVDIEAVRAIEPPLTRERLKSEKALASMMLLQRGARLSVQPVTAAQWAHVLRLAGLRGEL